MKAYLGKFRKTVFKAKWYLLLTKINITELKWNGLRNSFGPRKKKMIVPSINVEI